MTKTPDSTDTWDEHAARVSGRKAGRSAQPPYDRDIEAVLKQIVAQIGSSQDPTSQQPEGRSPAMPAPLPPRSWPTPDAPAAADPLEDQLARLSSHIETARQSLPAPAAAPPEHQPAANAGRDDEERLEHLWSVYSSVAEAYAGTPAPNFAEPAPAAPTFAPTHRPAPRVLAQTSGASDAVHSTDSPPAVMDRRQPVPPLEDTSPVGHWVGLSDGDDHEPAAITWLSVAPGAFRPDDSDGGLIDEGATPAALRDDVTGHQTPFPEQAWLADEAAAPQGGFAGLAEINAGFVDLRAQLQALAERFNEFEPLRAEVAGLASNIDQLRADMPALASDAAGRAYEQMSANLMAQLPPSQTAAPGAEVTDRLETIQGLLLTYARERQAETASAQDIIGSVQRLVCDMSSRLEVIERTMVGQSLAPMLSAAPSRAATPASRIARVTGKAPPPALAEDLPSPAEDYAAESHDPEVTQDDTAATPGATGAPSQQAAAEAWNAQSRSRLNALRTSMRTGSDAPEPEPKAPASRDDMIAAARRAAQAVSNRAAPRSSGPIQALREQAPAQHVRAPDAARSVLSFVTPRHAIALLAIVMVSLGAGVLYSKMMKARRAPVIQIEQTSKATQPAGGELPAAAAGAGTGEQSLLDDPNFDAPLPEGDAAAQALAAADAAIAEDEAAPAPASLGTTGGEGTEAAQTAEAAPKLDLPPANIGPLSLRAAAVEGDPAAQYEIGQRYTQAKGKDRDLAAAAKWFELSANSGHTLSKYRLGSLYERGLGVPKDLNKARAWYQAAADKGNVKAMHNLAVLYTGQDGTDPDYAAAGQWFGKAAEFGLADSQFNLAVLHESGLGMERNLQEAYKWYLLAAARGDAEAKKRGAGVRAKLAPKEAAEVKKAVSAWRAKPADRSANEGKTIGGLSSAKPATTAVPVAFTPGDPVQPEQIALVQRMLDQLGYNPGTLDGTMTFETREAIRLFEERSGMAPTGNLSAELIRRLGELAG